ncbi:DUF2827 domain-containing protein [Variovorax dokdonensis]|uniref:DUF2827 domain-containing protein n=1 Tax=Variovorax dokdonensis TaxID=344883 RepID=A0ABT7N627_9BURK|nr:DUF2827 domain-containing protein [Variovorax dokdonensis]MDM0043396.1 DUF2827 domain-containing protein [Variovorax dokdonensis]
MRVGISVISHAGQNIWENGMGQNVVFLARALQQVPFVEAVFLVDVGDQGAMPPQVDLQALELRLIRPGEAIDAIDVVIELAGALPAEWLAHFRACGGKSAFLCVGQPHVALAEPILFTDKAVFLKPQRCDRVWVLPKDEVFAPMMRTLHRVPVSVAPYLWSPMFLDARAQETERAGFRFGYQPARGKWRVAIFEPNISVVKNCLVPLLACDVAYRQRPDGIESMQVLNALHMKEHPTLLYLANSLDLVRQHKAKFHGRHDFAGFMVQHADAVVAHQWQNAQNYSYLDALHGGYPLVHNSPWLRELGYYYPDFDIAAAGAQLLHALQVHDAQLDDYRANARRFIAGLDPLAPANVDACARLLLELVDGDEAFCANDARSTGSASRKAESAS